MALLHPKSRQSFLPAGCHDYDYEEDITVYLRRQHLLAREKGLTAYIYIYRDASSHCRAVRSLMKRKNIEQAFAGTRIVMLQRVALDLQHSRDRQSGISPPRWAPAMARIDENGTVEGTTFFPDVYLFHPDRVGVHKYEVKTKKGRFSKKDYANYMRKYFNDNNQH